MLNGGSTSCESLCSEFAQSDLVCDTVQSALQTHWWTGDSNGLVPYKLHKRHVEFKPEPLITTDASDEKHWISVDSIDVW